MRKVKGSRFLSIVAAILASLLLASAQPRPSYAFDLKKNTRKAKTYTTDSALTAEIKGKFLVEKDLDSLDIKVKTTNGIVTLRGQVEKAFQAGVAERIARETKGVRGVVNKISVMP